MKLLDRLLMRPAPEGAAPGPQAEQMLASLLVLAWVVEARDPCTGGHLWRVSRYAALLCERAGLPLAECARICIGGFLHDLGKVGVPDAILRKPGALSEDELATMRTHPTLGARMLAAHPWADWVRDAVYLHHERPDGSGYPQGLRGAQIPLAARVVGLCDAFDAMTSARPYRKGLPIAQALSVVEAALGRQFDAELGQHLLALGAAGLLDHVAGHSDDGIPLQHCVMCGPTLVLRREQHAGEKLYCASCGAAYVLQPGPEAGTLRASASGEHGTAADLTPAADTELIARFVRDVARRALAHEAPGA
jgi:hypothetical protein